MQKKIDEIIEKLLETQRNKNNGNSNIAYIRFEFVNFVLIINQVIQNNLQS